MKNNKGFTLIEIIAVVVILGLVLAIAVPAVSSYITSSRKTSYISTVSAYVENIMSELESKEFGRYPDDKEIFIVPCEYIDIESGDKDNSPFGAFDFDKSYVIVTSGNGGFDYYVNFVDEAKYGIIELAFNEFSRDKVEKIDSTFIRPWRVYRDGGENLIFKSKEYELCSTRNYNGIENAIVVMCDINSSDSSLSNISINVNFYTSSNEFINTQKISLSDYYPIFMVAEKKERVYQYGNALSTSPTADSQLYSIVNYVDDDFIKYVYDSYADHSINLYAIWVDKSYYIKMPDGNNYFVQIEGEKMKSSTYRSSINSSIPNFSGSLYFCSGEVIEGKPVSRVASLNYTDINNAFIDYFYDISYSAEAGWGSNAYLWNNSNFPCPID